MSLAQSLQIMVSVPSPGLNATKSSALVLQKQPGHSELELSLFILCARRHLQTISQFNNELFLLSLVTQLCHYMLLPEVEAGIKTHGRTADKENHNLPNFFKELTLFRIGRSRATTRQSLSSAASSSVPCAPPASAETACSPCPP